MPLHAQSDDYKLTKPSSDNPSPHIIPAVTLTSQARRQNPHSKFIPLNLTKDQHHDKFRLLPWAKLIGNTIPTAQNTGIAYPDTKVQAIDMTTEEK
eukprot:468731-Amorphochlora_amoeboformis.AAC.1